MVDKHEVQRVLDQLTFVKVGLEKLKESASPGKEGKALAVGLTYLETAMLWIENSTRTEQD